MRRVITSRSKRPALQPEFIPVLPDDLTLTLDAAVHRCRIAPVVAVDDSVNAGDTIAEGPYMRLHAPVQGVISSVTEDAICIKRTGTNEVAECSAHDVPEKTGWPEFMKEAGMAGMGGGMFPYPSKMDSALAVDIHTLVVNAVECEPGIAIDEAIFTHQHSDFMRGVQAIAESLGIRRTVIGVRKSIKKRLFDRITSDGFEMVVMDDTYPNGAGKLIVSKLVGYTPPAGIHNSELGCLVMNVSSLWALGRRLTQGRPCIDRPLTLLDPNGSRNIIVPIGTPVEHLIKTYNIEYDAQKHIIIAAGFMMGKEVGIDYAVVKGTNALFIQPVSKRLLHSEQPCILCGSCFDACPLNLHPIGMADRIKARKFSKALELQLKECFLCGACAAVCPADIPLAHYFREGKQWLKDKK